MADVSAVLTSIPAMDTIHKGTPAFRRTNLAMFAAGFSTFAVLYCPQPLMPVFTQRFAVSPAESSLVVSLATGALSVSILVAGVLSDRFGRKGIMTLSILLASLLTVGAGLVADFHQMLALRLLTGIAISGVPSISMAYLGEEIDARSVGLAIGLFIGGSALGGMAGRVGTAVLADWMSWRLALVGIGGVGVVAGLLFWRSLPPSRHFTAAPLRLSHQLAGLGGHWRDGGLPWLFFIGFLLMGGFVTLYNYIGFRLAAPPFSLSQAAVGALFTVYLCGIVSSAWIGGLADRYGRRKILWLAVTIILVGVELTRSDDLIAVVVGVAVVTFGFFGAHAIATSWIARRARTAKAQASSLYMFFYYMGSSVVGSLGGIVWSDWGWSGVATLLTGLQLAALAVALRLSFLAPLVP